MAAVVKKRLLTHLHTDAGKIRVWKYTPRNGPNFPTKVEDGIVIVPAIDAAITGARAKYPQARYDLQLAMWDRANDRYPNLRTFESNSLWDFINDETYEYGNMPLFETVREFQIIVIPKPLPAGGAGLMHDCLWDALRTACQSRNPPFPRHIQNAESFKAALGIARGDKVPADALPEVDALLGKSVRLEVTGDAASYMSPVEKTTSVAQRTIKLVLADGHWEVLRNAPFWGFAGSRWLKCKPAAEKLALYAEMVELAPERLKYLARQFETWYSTSGDERSFPTTALAYGALALPEPEPLSGQEEVWVAMATRTTLAWGDSKPAATVPRHRGTVCQKYDVCSAYPAAATSMTRLPFGAGTFKTMSDTVFAGVCSRVLAKESTIPLCIFRCRVQAGPGPRLFRLPSGKKARSQLAPLPGDYYTKWDLVAALHAGATVTLVQDGSPNQLTWAGKTTMVANDVFGWMRRCYDLRATLKSLGRPDLAAPVKLALNGAIGALARKRTLKRSVEKIEAAGGLLPGRWIGGTGNSDFDKTVVEMREHGAGYYRFPTARFAPFVQSWSRMKVASHIRDQLAAADVELRRVYVDGWVLEGTQDAMDLASAALPGGGPNEALGAVKLE